MTTLTGCDALHHEYVDVQRDGGTTPAAAEEAIESIDGVTSAAYATVETYSPGEGGMFSSEGMSVVLAVTIDPEHSIADPQEFLDFLGATAWSVNDRYPDGQVVIALTGGIDRNFDWAPIASAAFGEDYSSVDHAFDLDDYSLLKDAEIIAISTETYGERFGRWPSDAVDTPDGLLLDQPPVLVDVPAILEPEFYNYAASSTDLCTRVEFERAIGGVARYDGVVTTTIYSASGSILASGDQVGDGAFTSYCFGAERPDGIYATVETAPADGFIAVSETISLQ